MSPFWGFLLGIFGLCVLFSALLGGIFFLIYNGVLATVFSLPHLTYLQSWGMWLLISLIGSAFKSVKN